MVVEATEWPVEDVYRPEAIVPGNHYCPSNFFTITMPLVTTVVLWVYDLVPPNGAIIFLFLFPLSLSYESRVHLNPIAHSLSSKLVNNPIFEHLLLNPIVKKRKKKRERGTCYSLAKGREEEKVRSREGAIRRTRGKK